MINKAGVMWFVYGVLEAWSDMLLYPLQLSLCIKVCLWTNSLCVFVYQVFEFLIRLHSADWSDEEEVFPFIRTLIHFDTREFLNVLAMVRFLHVIFSFLKYQWFVFLVNKLVSAPFQTFEDFKNDKQALEYQQRIVDILLQVKSQKPAVLVPCSLC